MRKIIIFLTIFSMVYIPFILTYSFDSVNGTSMIPTYNNGDLLLVSRRADVNRGDVIIIYDREIGVQLCKRVIGVEGDVIEIRNGHIFRNGKLFNEDYILEQNWAGNCDEFTVKLGEIYVLGDNRNASIDSRDLGCLTKNQIKGVVLKDITKLCGIKFEHIIVIIILLIILCIIIYLINLSSIKNQQVVLEDTEVDEDELCNFENSEF